jgi:hypothetical protein
LGTTPTILVASRNITASGTPCGPKLSAERIERARMLAAGVVAALAALAA